MGRTTSMGLVELQNLSLKLPGRVSHQRSATLDSRLPSLPTILETLRMPMALRRTMQTHRT